MILTNLCLTVELLVQLVDCCATLNHRHRRRHRRSKSSAVSQVHRQQIGIGCAEMNAWQTIADLSAQTAHPTHMYSTICIKTGQTIHTSMVVNYDTMSQKPNYQATVATLLNLNHLKKKLSCRKVIVRLLCGSVFVHV